MTCEDCTAQRNRFDPACLQCGGRMLRAIQGLAIPAHEKAARCRVVLTDWMAMGHSEADLRRLGAKDKPRDRH